MTFAEDGIHDAHRGLRARLSMQWVQIAPIQRWCCLVCCWAMAGCGTTKQFTATEQLLVSDAVDSTVSNIDFRPLTGRKVYLDNTFMPRAIPSPSAPMVYSEYVTSSLRQQMLAANVLLSEKREDADLVVEVRMGALGFDGHSVTYGLPASNSLSTAASTLGGAPMLPFLPELSLAKKEAKSGAAKIALFAYDRTTLHPVWQSGIARSSSSARETWILGMGPLQHGTIYESTRFAGSRIFGRAVARLVPHEDDEPESLVDYKRSQVFATINDSELEQATTQNQPPSTTGTPDSPQKGPTSTAAVKPPVMPPAAVTPANATMPVKPPGNATQPNPAPLSAAPAPAASPSSKAPASGAPPSPPAGSPASVSPAAPSSTSLHIDDRAKK